MSIAAATPVITRRRPRTRRAPSSTSARSGVALTPAAAFGEVFGELAFDVHAGLHESFGTERWEEFGLQGVRRPNRHAIHAFDVISDEHTTHALERPLDHRADRAGAAAERGGDLALGAALVELHHQRGALLVRQPLERGQACGRRRGRPTVRRRPVDRDGDAPTGDASGTR